MTALTVDLHSCITGDTLQEILCLSIIYKDNLPWKKTNVIFILFFFLDITQLYKAKASTSFFIHLLNKIQM